MKPQCLALLPLSSALALLALPAAADTTLSAVQVISPLVSTATRSEADPLRLPFATTLIGREQMDDMGAVTLEDSLRAVPGLQHGTQGNYYTRFETRGLRDTQDVLVLMDGVPLRLLQGNADVTLIAPDLVDRIEFIKGPASALYGKNAIGGVAQFFMAPTRAGGEVSATLGSFGRTDGSARYRLDLERGHLYIGAANNDYDGFQRDAGRRQRAVMVGGEWRPSDRWSTGFQVYDTYVNANRGSIIPLQNGRPIFGIGTRDNYAIPGSHISGDYRSLAWKNRIEFANGWALQHLTSHAHYDRTVAGGITIVPPPAAVSKGWSESTTADHGMFHELNLSQLSAGSHWSNELQLGANLEQGWQNQASISYSNAPTYLGPDYSMPVTNVDNDPRGVRGATTRSRFNQRVRSFYVQDRFEYGALGLTAGLRHDRFRQRLSRSNTDTRSRQQASRTSPRIGVDWLFAEDAYAAHALFANWSEGFRPQAVALNTRDGVVVPTILQPERTRSKEVGIKGRAANEAWSYQLSLFQADKIDGQRSYRNGPDSFVFSNATSRVRGVESQLQWRLSAQLSGYAHYTWQDAKHRDFQTYDNAGRPTLNYGGYRVRMSARHIAGLGLFYRHGPWTTALSSNYVGSRMLRDNVVRPQKLPAYLLANIAVSRELGAGLIAQAGINNLGNKFYISDDLSSQEAGNAGAPRTVFVRLRHAF